MHPEQPLMASCHHLAIIASFKSLFLIFGNFEPVLHWSRSVEASGQSVQSMSFCSGTATSDNRCQVMHQSWRLDFRTIEPVLHPSRWVEAVEAVAERPIQVFV